MQVCICLLFLQYMILFSTIHLPLPHHSMALAWAIDFQEHSWMLLLLSRNTWLPCIVRSSHVTFIPFSYSFRSADVFKRISTTKLGHQDLIVCALFRCSMNQEHFVNVIRSCQLRQVLEKCVLMRPDIEVFLF